MCRISDVAFAAMILAVSFSMLAADDVLRTSQARWLKMLREQIPRVSDSEQRTATAMTVVILTEAGHSLDAIEIARQQSNADTKNSLLISIATSLAQQSAFETAFSTVNEISDAVSKERAKHEVARALAKAGELERAESLIQELSEDYFIERVIAEVCEYLARDGKLDEALTRSIGITDSYRKNEVEKLIERIRNGTATPLEQLSDSLRDRVHTLTAFPSDGTYDSVILAIVAAKAGDRAGALKHIRESIGQLDSVDIPPKKIPTAILACVALAELDDMDAAGDLVVSLYNSAGKDWSGLSTAFGSPILMSLLVRLERFDAIDEIVKRKREGFDSDPTSSWYLSTLESLAESLVEQGRIEELESRLERVNTPEERLYLLMGAIIGADYARRTKP